MVIKICDVEL